MPVRPAVSSFLRTLLAGCSAEARLRLAMAGVVLALALPADAQTLTKTITSGTVSCPVVNCLQVSMGEIPSLGIDITGGGTWDIVVQGLRGPEGAATWTTISTIADADLSAVTSMTAAGSWSVPNSGFTAIRIFPSSYTSGSPVVSITPGKLNPLTAGGGGGGGSGDFTISAHNAAFGTAGAADSQVRSVQGIAGGTALAVSDGAGSLTVDNGGTFAVQAAQSGTWNVTNISGTVSLPTGAATSANQSTQITALQLIDNIPITIGSTTSGQSGVLGMGAVTTSAPSYTNAQSAPLSLTTGGLLRVAIEAGAGSGGTAMADDAAFTVGTTSVTPVGYLLDDSATDTVNEGDIGAPRMSSNRVPFAQIRDAAGNERGANVNASNQLSVSVDAIVGSESDDGTVAASQSAPRVLAQLYGFDGTNWVRASTNADPCSGGAKVFVAISQTASTQLLTGTASNRTYVCSLVLSQPSASTQTFALVSGTGTTCGTGTAAVIGATTAANGMQIPFSAGSGAGSIAKSAANADNVCLLQSSTDRIAGVLGYVVAP